MKKLIALIIALIFVLSLIATPALAGNTLSVSAFWTANQDYSISLYNYKDDPELKVFISSTEDFKLWIDVLNTNYGFVKNVVSGLSVSADINNPYIQNFIIPKTDLPAGDYLVRINAVNGIESEDIYLNLRVKRIVSGGNNYPEITNHAPEMSPIGDKQVFEGNELRFGVSAEDLDGDPLTYEVKRYIEFFNYFGFWTSKLPEEMNFNSRTGELTFSPDYNFVKHPALKKDVNLAFQASDGKKDSGWVEMDILVKDVNQIPVIEPKINNKEINEGEALTITVIGVDEDNDDLHFTVEGLPEGATFRNLDGYNYAVFFWKPDYNQAGNYRVTFWVHDDYGGKSSDSLSIKVNDVNLNKVPVANDDQATTEKNEPVVIDVLVNDNDPDGDAIWIDDATKPGHGTVKIFRDNLEYTPDLDFVGHDQFTYVITDGQGSARASVFVEVIDDEEPEEPEEPEDPVYQCNDKRDNDGDGLIDFPADPGCDSPEDDDEYNEDFDPEPENHAPTAVDDSAELFEGTSVEIDVLANDYDVDGDEFRVLEFTQPTEGNVVLHEGKIRYSVRTGFVGTETFTYTITDRDLEDTAEVRVEVKGEDQPVYQCSDNLDNDGDGLIDYPLDPGCDSPEDDDEYNEPEPEPEMFSTNLKITSARFAEEVVSSGDYALLAVNVKNKGNVDLGDVKITVMIFDLGLKRSTSKFDLESCGDETKMIHLPIPYDAPAGEYTVKITAGNSQDHDSEHRSITIV